MPWDDNLVHKLAYADIVAALTAGAKTTVTTSAAVDLTNELATSFHHVVHPSINRLFEPYSHTVGFAQG